MSASRSAIPVRWDHGLRRETIVQSLLGDMFRGRLAAGEHLVTQRLAERFGVSHTPVREALITLAGIGLVELLPNRGAKVRRVSEREIREVCEVRRVLECEATRRACGRLDDAELAHLEVELTALTGIGGSGETGFIEQARVIDSRLHDLIAAGCGNAFLANELTRLKFLFRAFRDFAWEHYGERRAYGRLAEEAHEHLAIVAALRSGDPKAAARAMARHIRSGLQYWSRVVPDAQGSRPDAKPRPISGSDSR